MKNNHTSQIERSLSAFHAGEGGARERLIEAAVARLRHLTRQMFRDDRLRRWEDSDDVMQQAVLRLQSALQSAQPKSAREFLGLAALQIRRTMWDLARHYYGPEGMATHHESPPVGELRMAQALDQTGRSCPSPERAPLREEKWEGLYAAIDRLPENERETVDLVWFQGLTQVQAAAVLDVSTKTVWRRWQAARIKLYDWLNDDTPPL